MKGARSHSNRPDVAPGPTLDMVDAAQLHCQNIETIAGLLAACGHQEGAEPLESKLAADAGWMIANEVRKLRDLVKALPINAGPTRAQEDSGDNNAAKHG